MENFKIKIKLITDILKEKKEKLHRLAIITENQGTVLESKEKTAETVSMLTELINEKQKIIDEILSYDDVFLKIYEEIKIELNNEKVRHNNRDEILEMQELILNINESNEKVIVLERANDEIVNGLKTDIDTINHMKSESSNNRERNIVVDTEFKPKSAPMSMEYSKTTSALEKAEKNKSANKPIATLDLKAELNKASNVRESVITGRQETGKRYRLKNMIEQYKNNNRQA